MTDALSRSADASRQLGALATILDRVTATREFLRRLFLGVLAEIDPERLVEAQSKALQQFCQGLPPPLVLAVGKAAVGMALGVFQAIGPPDPRSFVTALDAPAWAEKKLAQRGFGFISASHPWPNLNSQRAAQQALAALTQVSPQTPVILAISGGTSAAWCAPKAGLTLDALSSAWALGFAQGWEIKTLNTLRRGLSQIKGGGLLRAAGSRPLAHLALMDVVDGEAQDLGSGPGVLPGPTSPHALAAIRQVWPLFSPEVQALLQEQERQALVAQRVQNPGPWWSLGDPSLLRDCALGLLQSQAPDLWVDPTQMTLGGDVLIQAEAISRWLRAAQPQQALVLSGETQVPVPSTAGQGGRAQHLALAIMQQLKDFAGPWSLLSVASDGQDGNSGAAGAVVDETLVQSCDFSALERALAAADSAAFLRRHDAQIHTGSTGTNLTDLCVVLRC